MSAYHHTCSVKDGKERWKIYLEPKRISVVEIAQAKLRDIIIKITCDC
jgi:hypothetical protein